MSVRYMIILTCDEEEGCGARFTSSNKRVIQTRMDAAKEGWSYMPVPLVPARGSMKYTMKDYCDVHKPESNG